MFMRQQISINISMNIFCGYNGKLKDDIFLRIKCVKWDMIVW